MNLEALGSTVLMILNVLIPLLLIIPLFLLGVLLGFRGALEEAAEDKIDRFFSLQAWQPVMRRVPGPLLKFGKGFLSGKVLGILKKIVVSRAGFIVALPLMTICLAAIGVLSVFAVALPAFTWWMILAGNILVFVAILTLVKRSIAAVLRGIENGATAAVSAGASRAAKTVTALRSKSDAPVEADATADEAPPAAGTAEQAAETAG